MERYRRNFPAISKEEQEILGSKSVCVIGCGGLGGYVIEYLARIGVGRITAVDGDSYEPSNLNRQLFCRENTLSRGKAETAAECLRLVNSQVTVSARPEFLDGDNWRRILMGHDLAIDALDNVPSRLLLENACEALEIPLIHGAVCGWSAQVAVCMPGEGRLKAMYGDAQEEREQCCLAFAPALCAAVQAAEAVKLLCGKQPSLRGRMLVADLENMVFEAVEM